ncbi:MAG: type II secretion system F family protein [bacterium]
MITYVWKGRTPGGEVQSGEVAVESFRELAPALRRKRIILISAKEKGKEGKKGFSKSFGGGVKTKDLAIFTRQFATMINAGLPLVQCLDTLTKQTSKPMFREVIGKVMKDVESGGTLAESLAKHKSVFQDLYVHMVAAGEAGGILDVILMRLATFLEKMDALKRKVKTAMTYPTVVMTVAIGATVFMLLFIIPTFAKMFSDFGGILPLPTRIVLGASNFLRNQWWLLIGTIVGSSIAFKRFVATEKGRLRVDGILLNLPAIGDILRKAAVARFTRTLGTLIASGVPILEGLNITAKTAGNMVVHNAVLATRAAISEGETIAVPLRASGVFPPMVVQMIAIGEETGALDEMLNKIADFYEDEVDSAVEALTSIIEPIMIVFMGGVVGTMVVAMYLPIFKMVSVIMAGS